MNQTNLNPQQRMETATKYVHTTNLHNTTAATEVVPMIINLVHPKSVVDVGCGLGTWLRVFEQNGIKDIMGVDGEHLDRSMLTISPEQVHMADLEKPVRLGRRFDLCITLEVGEHLAPESAAVFVKSLCDLSDVILFSAAIPGQGGQNHVNEQWYEYWQDQFARHEYAFYDVLRPLPEIWNNPRIDWWYKQNMFLVAKKGKLDERFQAGVVRAYIHPQLLAEKTSYIDQCLTGGLKPAQYLKLLGKSLLKTR